VESVNDAGTTQQELFDGWVAAPPKPRWTPKMASDLTFYVVKPPAQASSHPSAGAGRRRLTGAA
jgi:hypothetical protein